MRFEGTLKTWNDERGFGFIEPTQGGQEIFVHIRAFEYRPGRPQIGERVSFELELNHDGNKRAVRVQVARPASGSKRHRTDALAQRGTAGYFALPAFLGIYVFASAMWRVPSWVGVAYLAASVTCFLLYAIDKSAAVAGRRRIPEANLILLGLAGGWPGAIFAQQLLRHKSNKASFQAAFWGSVAMNSIGFLALSSPLTSLLRS